MTLQYTSLDSSKPQIRLLTVHPGGFDDEIKCSLHLTSLDETIAFTALSYVWGDPSICEPIIVNGSVVSVTVNLKAALRRLRQEENPQVLWVDAICINQADLDEKAAQIPFMSRIYSTAGRVVAWLGEDHEFLGLTLSWIRTHVQKEMGPSWPFWPTLDSKVETLPIFQDRTLAVLGAKIGYIKFITNPYWERIWTFAEFWLPSQEPECVCGPYSFHASIFPDMVASEKFGDITQRTHQRLNGVELDALAKPGVLTESVLNECNDQTLPCTLASTQSMRINRKRSVPWSAASALLNTSGRRFTDPHDRVYGLYSLVPNLREAFSPSYNKPVIQVVQETCAFVFNIHPADEIVTTTRNFQTFFGFMFATFPPRKDRFTDIKYASWALDLLGEDAGTPRAWMSPSLRHHHALPYARADTGLLVLHARYLGNCQVYRRFGTHTKEIEQLSQMCRDVSTDDQKIKQLRVYSTYEHPEVSYLSDAELLQYFSHQLSLGLSHQEKESGEGCDVTFYIMLSDLEGKALIQTRGRFGVSFGHSDEQDGDVIVLCPAMAHPLVLRVGEPDPCYGDVRYKIVGIVYVEGIIEDGGLDKGFVEELLKEPLQVFHI
ncbi:heterokaryon incompatibility protein-domain-containing protein, partial [Cladorrhinum sp. PSN259]